jgi:hypothetical protein
MNRSQENFQLVLLLIICVSVIIPVLADNSTNGTVTPTDTGNVTASVTETANLTATATETMNATTNATETMNATGTATLTATESATGTANETANVTANETVNATPTETMNITPVPNATVMPISEADKTIVTNIAINLTVNIGIVNPTVVDIQRDTEDQSKLRVKVKDHDTNEIIIVIVNPQQPLEQAQVNVPSPVFTEVENNFSGSHVSFQYNQSTITNFTVNGVTVFDTINLGFTSTNTKAIGTEFRIFNDKDMFIVHDNDNGIITEKCSEHIKQHFEASPDIKVAGNGNRVDLSEKIKASIVSSSTVVPTVSGNAIDVDINQGESTFVSTSNTTDLLESRIVDGIAQQQVGSVVNIQSESVHDITAFDVDTSVDQVATNIVSLSVNSTLPQGKVIALTVNKDILKDLNLKVLVDNGEIPLATNFDDLFKVDSLKYLLVVGQEVEILVAVPHFSEHQITVTSAQAPTMTSTAMATATATNIPLGTTSTATATPAATTTLPAPQATPPTSVPVYTLALILFVAVVILVLYIMLIKRK